jgi:hypothetical protein
VVVQVAGGRPLLIFILFPCTVRIASRERTSVLANLPTRVRWSSLTRDVADSGNKTSQKSAT